MSTLSKKLVAICLVTTFSMVMYGCGGGGGSSSDDEMTMMPPPEPTPDPIECPAGQEPNAANDACVDTAETIAAKAVAATKAAATKTEAIAAEAAQTAQEQLDRGLGGDDAVAGGAGQQAGSYNLNIEYGETSIVKEAAAEADNETFTQAMDLGGGTTMHVLTADADMDGNVVEEVAMVHTDIEAPTPTAFAMWQMADGTTPQALNARDLDQNADGPDGDGDNTNDWTALNVVTANVAQIMSSGFSTSGAGELSYPFDDAGTTGMDEAFETTGTYNGAPGTYRCNGTAACTVTYDAMGAITAVTGGWVFTPDAGATSDQPDYDYLNYGFWLQRTTDKDGAVTYNEVETFAGSSIAASGSVAQVRGTATYTGGALGVYVHEVRNPAGNIASATSGHFTADVTLTATFAQTTADDTGGADQIPPRLLNSLSGTINNFALSGHDEGPGWSVTLEQGAIDTGAGTATGVTKGGGTDGAYSATFHGPTGDDSTTQPHSVVGEFGADFSNGSVAGGFGARKD